MPAAVADPRYWAFISYSHADEAWARWLHGAIETWRVPWRLVGHPHPDGPIPRRLFPVFRDRDELSSSHELGGAIRRALEQSRYLIVICSPRSAGSRWVNEEIRHFKAMGREARVLALIVDGEPGSAGTECFAPALSRRVAADGRVLDAEAVEPIAADVRAGRDSRRIARLRLLAGMLGIGFDALQRREHRRMLLRALGGGVAAATMFAAMGSAWQWREQRIAEERQLEQVETWIGRGRQALAEGAHGRAAAALIEAARLGGSGPRLSLPLRRAMAPGDALIRRLQLGQPVTGVALSGDGRRVAALGHRDRLMIWDVDSGQLLFEHEGKASQQRTTPKPVFSPDGRHVYAMSGTSGAQFERLRLVDLVGPRLVWDQEVGASNPIWPQHVFSPDGTEVVFIDRDGQAATLDLPRGRIVRSIQAPRRLRVVAFHPDGTTLATGDIDGNVRLHDAASGAPVRSFEGLDAPISTIGFSRDGRYLAAGAGYGALRIWDSASGRLHIASGHRFTINGLVFARDDSRFLSLADDGLRVWELSSGALVRAPDVAHQKSKRPALHPDGDALVLTDGDQAELIDPASGERLHDFDAHAGGAFDADFDAAGTRIAIGGGDGAVTVWRYGIHPQALHRHRAALNRAGGQAATHAQFSPDGRLQASAGTDGVVQLRRVNDQRLLQALSDHSASIEALWWMPDSRSLVSVQIDGRVQRFDAQTGQRLLDVRSDAPLEFWPFSQLSNDGRRLLLPHADPTARLRIVDLDRGEISAPQGLVDLTAVAMAGPGPDLIVADPQGIHRRSARDATPLWRWAPTSEDAAAAPMGSVVAVDTSRDRVFAGLDDTRLILLDASSGELLAERREGVDSPPIVASLAPDGRGVAFSTVGHVVYLWTPATDRLQRFAGHTDLVHSLEFTPDGRVLLSASFDGSLRLWSVDEGVAIGDTRVHAGGINSFDLHPDGRLALLASADNRVSVIDLAPETRTPAELSAKLACTSTWRVENNRLQRRAPQPCADASAVAAHADAP